MSLLYVFEEQLMDIIANHKNKQVDKTLNKFFFHEKENIIYSKFPRSITMNLQGFKEKDMEAANVGST